MKFINQKYVGHMWGVCILVFGEGLSLIVDISNFSKNVKYSRRVLKYSLRYSPSTRVANYSDSTALLWDKLLSKYMFSRILSLNII